MKMTKMLLALVLVLALSMTNAFACTAIYVGADLTTDGSAMFARSEDISNSYNKLFYVSPAANHKAGEAYQGCYGFTYTFTKDSYSYTAFGDDFGAAAEICPDCDGTHPHTPYEAGGTNSMGVTVSATETLSGDKAVRAIDPYEDAGIEEAEMVTVLLSESATAREGVELLLSIYDNAGCAGGSGVFIADNTETWYIENVTGHEYIALKLTDTMAFAVPNQSVIGLIDLDDTDNVIASAKLIEVAKQAGTYVGDEAANTIDYVASYNPNQKASGRMVSALKHFNAATAKEEPANSDYTISNVDATGNIVPLYTNIIADRTFSVEDIVAYYAIDGIGKDGNLEIHIFQVFDEDSKTDTVEWVAMDCGLYNAFVPYYPMLTTDTYAAYQLSTAKATFTQEEPTDADVYYPTTGRIYTEEGRKTVEGFKVLPANWADSYYWTMDALSNLAMYSDVTDEQKAAIEAKLAELQGQCYEAYAQMQTAVANAADDAAAAAAVTEISANMAKTVHTAVVELVNAIK